MLRLPDERVPAAAADLQQPLALHVVEKVQFVLRHAVHAVFRQGRRAEPVVGRAVPILPVLFPYRRIDHLISILFRAGYSRALFFRQDAAGKPPSSPFSFGNRIPCSSPKVNGGTACGPGRGAAFSARGNGRTRAFPRHPAAFYSLPRLPRARSAMRFHVIGPTMPLTSSPSCCWIARTAVSVFEPKMPSTCSVGI